MPTPITSRDDWRLQAVCRDHDPDMWFPNGVHGPNDPAKIICATCPVRTQCAELGLPEHFGIWGGLNEADRDLIRRGITPPRDEPGTPRNEQSRRRQELVRNHILRLGYDPEKPLPNGIGVRVEEDLQISHAQFQSARRAILRSAA
ncbi:WhiB family transcriptional regulator [Tsukamurella sp. USMM236]|uniref:WhiB family transcriptional regulator n=1 Tax=Tsukamurella sp. USMM236 TaxID=3081301 RepID=UPI0030168D59